MAAFRAQLQLRIPVSEWWGAGLSLKQHTQAIGKEVIVPTVPAIQILHVWCVCVYGGVCMVVCVYGGVHMVVCIGYPFIHVQRLIYFRTNNKHTGLIKHHTNNKHTQK